MLEMKVTGMTCGGCAKSVERALLRLDASAKVLVDLPSGRVQVEGKIRREEAEKAITLAGFGAEPVQPEDA
jgi:copper chaperone